MTGRARPLRRALAALLLLAAAVPLYALANYVVAMLRVDRCVSEGGRWVWGEERCEPGAPRVNWGG